MKKLVFSLLALALTFSTVFAQDAKSAYKKAKKAHSASVNADEDGQIAKLQEAMQYIEQAIAGIDQFDAKKQTGVWLRAGEIFNDVADRDYKMATLGREVMDKEASLKAYNAYKNVYDVATKKWERNDASKALLRTASFLSNGGINAYTNKDYQNAYNSFQGVLDIHELLKANDAKTLPLTTDTAYYEHIYRTALTAQLVGENAKAKDLYKKSVGSNFAEAGSYSGLHVILRDEGDEDGALKYLEEGRQKFPDDPNLGIYEINFYLNKGKLDELVNKLETAIQKDKTNLSLYSTLGNVYDQLHQREAEGGNADKSKEYFDKALDYYGQALEIDGQFGPALYNTGALYFNAAAQITREMAALEDDYSPAGTRKYEAKKSEMMKMFDDALPFFQKSESLSPNDIGTLGALMEIYARKDDLEKYNEFKSRMERVQNGETIAKSYF